MSKTEKPEVTIDPEFSERFPHHTKEERSKLEKSLRSEGCRDPLVVWKETGILVDGHTRHEICTEYGIEYGTCEISFEDRDQAKVWMLENQSTHRNLTAFQRAEVALKLKDSIAKEAKRNQKAGVRLKSDKGIDTLKRLVHQITNNVH